MRTLRSLFGSDPLAIDEQTAEGLLGRALPPDDAPPAYREVARVIGALTQPPTRSELEHESRAVAAIAAAVASTADSPSRRSSLPRPVRSRRKTLAAVAVSCLGLVGGLAAAGALGTSVPSPNDASDGSSTAGEHTPTSVPPGDTGQGGENDGQNGGGVSNGKGEEISGLATETDATGVDKGAEISDTASDGMSRAGEEHPGGAGPPVPVSTPGQAEQGQSHRP
jgi:hypothetical protein